jgi:hypothetical protein
MLYSSITEQGTVSLSVASWPVCCDSRIADSTTAATSSVIVICNSSK